MFNVKYRYKNWKKMGHNDTFLTKNEFIEKHTQENWDFAVNDVFRYEKTLDYKCADLDKLVAKIFAIKNIDFNHGYPYKIEFKINNKAYRVFVGKKNKYKKYGLEYFMSLKIEGEKGQIEAVWGTEGSYQCKKILEEKLRRKYEYDDPYRWKMVSDDENNTEKTPFSALLLEQNFGEKQTFISSLVGEND